MRTSDRTADLRVGVDVGGTNTDAVVLDAANRIVASTKQPTSPDVTAGMRAAVSAVLAELGEDRSRVGRVMLGTTHAVNAILERRRLGRVAAVRLGAPSSLSIPPLESWPDDLRRTAVVSTTTLRGGYYVDGRSLADLDRDGLRRFLGAVAGRVDAIALTGVFSPASPEQELQAAEITAEELGPDVAVSLSHEIGALGLLERENATVLNAMLYRVARHVRDALQAVLDEHGLRVSRYFTQNDGTLMEVDFAARYPVLTIGSGPANSIRGAAYLSGFSDAIVADVGGTSTDLGVLVNGFPRVSSVGAEIGGVRTNFRMPDILALALGGGTVIDGDGVPGITSVGYRIGEEALVFGGGTPTMTDACVAAGRTGLGRHRVPERLRRALAAAVGHADERVADAVDRMSLGKAGMPLVVVGGGAFLVPDGLPGVAAVVRPEHGGVANAVGAAIALVSGSCETIAPAGNGRREAVEAAAETARRRAVQAGADPSSVEIVEMSEIPLSYLPEPSLRVQIKAAGPLGKL
ncbi:hydantoinase/oxoprolinase family protein [Rhizohabitans arisaemae]|uniref:hydantoinase/oxoprolinase family protein n=1 Tax=Rhizohabitans arisaemae TaxID=2720610 RepID=UPI0024B1AC20|nr:hydantoinase/oxoprolinase family protein [Rhizohabitans arisaemae]